MSYATLEEAYKIPSFELNYKKRRSQGKSAIQQLAEENSRNIHTASGRPIGAARAAPGAPDMVEHFVDSSAPKKSNALSTAPKNAYLGQLNDYIYGCKQYGVCPSTLKMAQSSVGPAVVVAEGFEAAAPAKKEPIAKFKTDTCGELQVLTYEVPLSEKDRTRHRQAMGAALSMEPFGAGAPLDVPYTTEQFPIVDGYDEDDLDQYLSPDLKEEPSVPPKPSPRAPARPPPEDSTPEPYDPTKSSFLNLLRLASEKQKAEQNKKGGARSPSPPSPPSPPTPFSDRLPKRASSSHTDMGTRSMWMDLLLFVLVGVVVILIMDQLHRLATTTTVTQVMRTLEPVLQHMLEEMKATKAAAAAAARAAAEAVKGNA